MVDTEIKNDRIVDSEVPVDKMTIELSKHNLPKLEYNPFFKQQLTDVKLEDITKEHIDLTTNMFRFLTDIHAASLAAPQLGINKRFFTAYIKGNIPKVFYNPKYFVGQGTKIEPFAERCLSFGKEYYAVKRMKYIMATWYEQTANGFKKVSMPMRDYEAEMFQHGTDWCNGETIATKGVKLNPKGNNTPAMLKA